MFTDTKVIMTGAAATVLSNELPARSRSECLLCTGTRTMPAPPLLVTAMRVTKPTPDAQEPAAIKAGQIERMTPTQVASAFGARDVIVGLRFHATHQLRIPMRVLSRNGEIHRDTCSPPPVIATAPFEGSWVPLTKTFRELGIDMDEIPDGAVASDIGPVPSDEYLPFLIAVRSIVERDEPAAVRRGNLMEELKHPSWVNACARLGGAHSVADRFFPSFVSTIKGLPLDSGSALRSKGLTTPAALARASDADLLAINGIGPAKLFLVRSACSEAIIQEEELCDRVLR